MFLDDITIEQIVTFAILMENNDGIMGKAPSYIREKFRFCMLSGSRATLLGMLDSENKAKFEAWRQRWTSQK